MTASQPTALWRPASEFPPEALTALDGAEVGDDVTLELLLGPKSAVGSRYFRLHLRSDLGRTVEDVVTGLQNSGPYPGFNWVEVLHYRDHLQVEDGRRVAVPPGVELRIFQRLASLVPAGGHLMAEYDSEAREMTARALVARIPPRATPLGTVLAAVGCGDAFRDWYIPEGGREGPRKLQGFRAVDQAHARKRGLEMLTQLEAFMARDDDLDWNVLALTRPLAEAAIADLRGKYAAPSELNGPRIAT